MPNFLHIGSILTPVIPYSANTTFILSRLKLLCNWNSKKESYPLKYFNNLNNIRSKKLDIMRLPYPSRYVRQIVPEIEFHSSNSEIFMCLNEGFRISLLGRRNYCEIIITLVIQH